MSNLNTKYVVNLDLNAYIENEVLEFSLSDNNTSDFYINLSKNESDINKEASKNIVTLYVVKPNGNFRYLDLVYDKDKRMYYCNLGEELKNVTGKYVAQVVILDSSTGERKATTSKFKYHVSSDILSDMNGAIDEEEQGELLDSIIDRLLALEQGGAGVPTGGTTGQILAKASNADRDVKWITYESVEREITTTNVIFSNSNYPSYTNLTQYLSYLDKIIKSNSNKISTNETSINTLKASISNLNASNISYNDTYSTVELYLNYVGSSLDTLKQDDIALRTALEDLRKQMINTGNIEYTNGEYDNLKDFLDHIESDKVDKVEGMSLMSDDEIARLADVDNYDDTELRTLIDTKVSAIKTHTHSNKDALDRITNEDIDRWNNGGGDVDLSDYALDEDLTKTTNRVSNLESNVNKMLDVLDTPPTFIKPSFIISSNTNVIEHKVSTQITITPNFTQNDSGGVSNYVLTKDGVQLMSGNLQTYRDTISLTHGGLVTYNGTVTYLNGSSKTSTFGVEYPGLSGGTLSANNIVKCYARSYYGVIDESMIDEPDIPNLTNILSTSKSRTLTFDMTKQRCVYMYPQSLGALTTIKDSNNFEYINSYTRTTMTYNEVDYYVYILTDPVTITGFKQIFN